jgi:hypothetical protein
MEKLEKRCPLEKSHTRLRQVHTLWHEALDAYPVPELFIARLNALLQAARSVTWVLQQEMRHDEGFEEWYGAWQEKMRADERMRWLVEARNTVEKQGDLDLHSIATVRVLAGAYTGPDVEYEVPAQLGPAEIAAAVEVRELPTEIRESGLLEVERRWTVPERPEEEVLDLLAHAYGVLAALMIDAHARRGARMQTFGAEDHAGRHRRVPHPTGRLDCMIVGREQRIARWHLGHEELVEIETRTLANVGPEKEEARSRYDFTDWPKSSPGEDLERRAEVWHQWGRRFLERDRGHRTIASLFSPGTHTLIDVTPDDDQAKRANLAQLALEVDRLGADSLIFTTEAWFAIDVPADDPRHGVRARDRTDRKDTLVTYGIARDGTAVTIASDYELVKGEPELGEPYRLDADPRQSFRPVLEVWDRWPEPDDDHGTSG